MSTTIEVVALACIIWYIAVVFVCTVGYIQLFTNYWKIPKRSISTRLPPNEVPHVTVVRPCKGSEPYLYECLAATFQQDYPLDKLTLYLCVSSRSDPAYPTLKRVLKDFPQHDAKICIEEEDPVLIQDGAQTKLFGPNPKIRNMSRAYREAKGDIVWIIDCNVWVNRGTCGRMVDKLFGFTSTGPVKPYKFVHQLPIAVDVDGDTRTVQPDGQYDEPSTVPLLSDTASHSLGTTPKCRGGRLEELFLSSSHAKFYVAINFVAVAPCIVGKSNMFRISHLNSLTNSDSSPETRVGSGIDYFSNNICEDHLIGDLLWKSKLPAAKSWRNHGLVYGDFAIQPVASMTVANYIARRVRWLRVRKFTVPVATLVEPGTESFLCSLYGAFGFTTSKYTRHIFGDSWVTLIVLWLTSVGLWALVDRTVYLLLHSGSSIETETDFSSSSAEQDKADIPAFAAPLRNPWTRGRRPFHVWFAAWLGREALALPIWTWAIWGGVSVTWRDKRFWVGLDMRVHAYDDEELKTNTTVSNQEVDTQSNGYASSPNGSAKNRRRKA